VATELIIYADESEKKGTYYSNFFGAALVASNDLSLSTRRLESIKRRENLYQEIKWGKVTENYLNKYIAVIDEFFDMVSSNVIKIRIMFTDNRFEPQNLTRDQIENEYYILYYHLFKLAFGFQYHDITPLPVRCRIYLDDLPDTKEKAKRFKDFLKRLDSIPLLEGRILFDQEQIAEVNSHDHIILQCLDIVLGAMNFRLNRKHLLRPSGANTRGKRTIAKEKLYRHINRRIREIYPGFNIGMTTGRHKIEDLWNHQYRHWCFKPSDYVFVPRDEK